MSITTQSEITLDVMGRPFVLTGIINNAMQVRFHESPVTPGEQTLGPIEDVAKSVAGQFGVDPDDFWTSLNNRIGQLPASLKEAVDKLLSAKVIVTDLSINTNDPVTYQLGVYVNFDRLKYGQIEIVGFGVLFTYTHDPVNGISRGTLSAAGVRGGYNTRRDN